MATGLPTLIDIAARTGSDSIIGLIEEASLYQPEFSVVPARTRRGTTYMVTRRTELPTSAFRAVNDPITIGKSKYAQEVKQMYFVDCQLQVDEAAVQADDGELSDFLADEASGAFQSVVNRIGTQFYYGTTADTNGFSGLLAQSVGKVNTGGTSSSTSAYLVWLNPQGVQFQVGRDGEFSMPEWAKQAITSTGNKQLMAYVSNISTWIGLGIGSATSVWRVAGITKTAGADLTDVRGHHLISKVPLNRRQGLRWFMNRTAAFTLQASRKAIGQVVAGPGGAPAFSPAPIELAGIPITITDSITDTETNAGTTTADHYVEE